MSIVTMQHTNCVWYLSFTKSMRCQPMMLKILWDLLSDAAAGSQRVYSINNPMEAGTVLAQGLFWKYNHLNCFRKNNGPTISMV